MLQPRRSDETTGIQYDSNRGKGEPMERAFCACCTRPFFRAKMADPKQAEVRCRSCRSNPDPNFHTKPLNWRNPA